MFNVPILDRPPSGPLAPRLDVIRWLDPLPDSHSEPPLASWLVDVALDGKRRKPIHIVLRLLRHSAPTFDADPELALAEAIMRPWAVHGMEFRPPAIDREVWRKHGEPDSFVWFRESWFCCYGTTVVETGVRGDDFALPKAPRRDR